MQNFWRMLGILAVLAVVYVGHGLHTDGNHPMIAEAQGGITELPSDSMGRFVTSSPDGRTVFVWEWVGNSPHCVAKASVNGLGSANESNGEPLDRPPHFFHLAE